MRIRVLPESAFPALCRFVVLLALVGSFALAASASINVSATPSLPSPQPINTTITVTAAETGGTNVQYQFWTYNSNATPAWSQLQAFSTSATCTWIPALAGNYLLSITACDGATGTQANTTFWYGITGITPLSAVALSPSLPAPRPANTPITLTATATGGTDVQYQFWSYNPNASPAWSQLQAYSSSSTCLWQPTTVGMYLLSTTALDGVTGAEVNNTLWYAISGPTLTAVSVSATPPSPQPANTSITFSATATGGTNVQYQFWAYNPATTPAWTQLQAYSTSATCTHTPVAPGNYLISVTARDGVTGTEVSNTLWDTVSSPALTALSVTPSLPSPQPVNTAITLTAAATGGTNVQYQFWIYNQAATPAWRQLQDYSIAAVCTWTPALAGNYLFSVTARDNYNETEINQTFWYTISIPQLTGVSLSAFPASQQLVNLPVTLSASATAGVTAQYLFWLYNPDATPAWSELQAYSNSSTCTWTPTSPGSYLFSATAKDSTTGAEVNQTLWYTINASSTDQSAILALFAALQSATDTQSVNGMLALFSPDYMQAGADYTAVQDNLTQGLPSVKALNYAISNIAITGNTAQVTAAITLTFNNGNAPQSWTDPDPMQNLSFGWLIKSNGQWLFYGDQQRATVSVQAGYTAAWTNPYYLNLNINGQNITSATVSGPNIPLTTVPDAQNGWQAEVSLAQAPQVGDQYAFDITYTDGTQQTLTASIHGLIYTAPTLTVTPSAGSASFTWNDVSAQAPTSTHYHIEVNDPSGQAIWNRDYPLSTLSGAFNDDGNASAQLQSGVTYAFCISIMDQYNDFASSFTNVSIPGATVQMTVGHLVSTQNDHYFLQFSVTGQSIATATVSGPNISTTTLAPNQHPANVTPAQTPRVGDQYTFSITFTDGTLSTQTETVQSLVAVAPTLTITQPDSGGLSCTWNDVSAQVPNAAYYQLSVQDQNGNNIWQRQYPLSTLSGAFNDDGSASAQLQSGQTYTCFVQISDQYHDFAFTGAPILVSVAQTTVQVLSDYTLPQANPYSLMLHVNAQNIAAATVSGPNIAQTTLSADPSWAGYTANVTLAQAPQVGDAYTFVVTYADGTKNTLRGSVKGVVTVAPTLTVTQPSSGNLSFTWNDVSAQVAYANCYQLFVYGNGQTIWQQQYPLTTLSGAFNGNGSATQQLQSGQTYSCSVQILDEYGDCGMMNVTGVTIIAP